ncbi:MAG: hypothetical protein K2Q23_19335 [Bryobacteraceae bacterium]|nr:hypothetical protein [Bryobacteraceae bacterium]
MNYRVTVLTPTLIGDGDRLSPVDYMLYQDKVAVLDQRRIFKLLSKGPRLDGYLAQLLKADKLDFASWGGFAQNYAGRRIPLESPSITPHWNKARAEFCHIPTFATSAAGHFLPATALKGALRTAAVYAAWKGHAVLEKLAGQMGERIPRRLAQGPEEQALGTGGNDRMRGLMLADSAVAPDSAFRVYLLRTSTLVARGGGKIDLGWKFPGQGGIEDKRRDDATPLFAEMAAPGTLFSGRWNQPAHPKGRRDPLRVDSIIEAANDWATQALILHRQYAERTRLPALARETDRLEAELAQAKASPRSCLLCVGWGSGLLGKAASLDSDSEAARRIYRQLPYYARAVQTGLPFPKTRKIIFQNNQPATWPGWIRLEL